MAALKEFKLAGLRIDAAVIARYAGFARFILHVAGTCTEGRDLVHERILLAIHEHLVKSKRVAGGLAFHPEFVPRGRPKGRNLVFQGIF